MNLQKLFEIQAELDCHINKEHPVQEGEDRLAKKILALQVELGELCNCWRGFKFWSYKQEPITGLWDDRLRFHNPLLEEYVDCLHFVLSIGLEIGFTEEPTGIIREYDVIHQFNKMFYMVGDFYNFYIRYGKGCGLYDMFDDLFGHFLGIGEMLGFTWEQIERAYLEKNAENHRRHLQKNHKATLKGDFL
ncbi:dUTP diphosphatase [Ureibacillus sp. FSL K6-2830]|uniref:dUTP diphosphatase n=1 Tax=Ureibacillus sp. FSL K6-2830 TaxID=2954610 RepID=UPI0030F732BB